jgi:hypothetical protein
MLSQNRDTLPDHIMSSVSEDDRMVVEQIMLVAQAAFLGLNISAASVQVDNGKYLVTTPFEGKRTTVALADLRAIANYNPARIADIRVLLSETHGPRLRIDICNEATRMPCSQLDILRVAKRSKYTT